MLPHLLKPVGWRVQRQLRGRRRWWPAILLALWFLGRFLLALATDWLASVNAAPAGGWLAFVLPYSLFVFLIFGLLGLNDIVYQLFLAPDMPLLLVAPLPRRALFLFKWLQSSRALLMPVLFLGGFWLVWGELADSDQFFYLWGVLLLPAFWGGVNSLLIIFVLGLTRLLPPSRLRRGMPVALSLTLLAVMLGQQWLGTWLAAQPALLARMAAAADAPWLSWAAAAALLLAVGLGLAAYQLFQRTFSDAWSRWQLVPVVAPTVRSWSGRFHLLSRLLPTRLRPIVRKEWLTLRRHPQALLNLALPLVYIVIVLLPLLSGGGRDSTLRPLYFWYLFFFSAMLLVTMPTSLPLRNLLDEGRLIQRWRAAPLPLNYWLWGKLLASWLPLVTLWLTMLLVVGMWLGLSALEVTALLVTVFWGLTLTLVLTVALAGYWVDFSARNAKQRLAGRYVLLIILCNGAIVMLVVVTTLWSLVQFSSDAPVGQVRLVLTALRPLAWLTAPGAGVPAALVTGHIVVVALLFWFWRRAAQRLQTWSLPTY